MLSKIPNASLNLSLDNLPVGEAYLKALLIWSSISNVV